MKVAVSIPDDVFSQGEALAKRLSLSRSKLYARALAEYARNHKSDEDLTARINAALDQVGDEELEWVRRTSRRVFEQTEW